MGAGTGSKGSKGWVSFLAFGQKNGFGCLSRGSPNPQAPFLVEDVKGQISQSPERRIFKLCQIRDPQGQLIATSLQVVVWIGGLEAFRWSFPISRFKTPSHPSKKPTLDAFKEPSEAFACNSGSSSKLLPSIALPCGTHQRIPCRGCCFF